MISYIECTQNSIRWADLVQWLTPIVLFILAYVVNEWLKKRSRKKQLKKLKYYFFTILSSLIKQIDAQIKQNKDCIRRIDDFRENNIKINKIAGNSIKRINEINFDDLFELFVLNYKGKNKNEGIKSFHDLNNEIDYIETATPSIFDANIETMTDLNNIGNQWNSIFERIAAFRNQVAINFNKSQLRTEEDSFADGFINLYDKFLKNPENKIYNFHDTYHKLVIPLIKHSQSHSKDLRAQNLIELCSLIKILFDKTTFIRNEHSKHLTILTESLSKTNLKLTEFKNKSNDYL